MGVSRCIDVVCVLGWTAFCFLLVDAFWDDGGEVESRRGDVKGLYTEEEAVYSDNWGTTMNGISPLMDIIPFSVL